MGVMMFCVKLVVYGRPQRSAPSSAATPTTFPWVSVTTWRTPSIVVMKGEA
jgi:hypothetical protein